MAREGLLYDLRNAIARARKEKKPVRKTNIQIKNGNGNGNGHESAGNGAKLVSFDVIPFRIANLNEPYFMILFRDTPLEPASKPAPARGPKGAKDLRREAERITKLEEELHATKEYLQSVIETQEATNEELQSANEEILSSNEELQSTNEELETAKEELQSANEELTTVNDELRSRNLEITQVNNDLTNLLASIDLAVVMVAKDLTIRRFTPRAEKVMGLIPGDVGRPFLNINPPIEIPDLQQMVVQVVSNYRAVEKEITDRSGTRYQIRVSPCRTSDGTNDGAVVTLVDVPRK